MQQLRGSIAVQCFVLAVHLFFSLCLSLEGSHAVHVYYQPLADLEEYVRRQEAAALLQRQNQEASPQTEAIHQ